MRGVPAGMKNANGTLTMIRTSLHIPYLQRIRLWDLARRFCKRDRQLRHIEVMHFRFMGHGFGGVDAILDEMARCLDCVTVHGGGVND